MSEHTGNTNPDGKTEPLRGRVAIVTGASAGIGAAVAKDLAACGASVVVNARRGDRIEQMGEALNRMLGEDRVATAPGDAADGHTIDRMLSIARERFGEPDLVVVNAGRGLGGSVLTSDEAQWEDLTRINFLGAARLIRAVGRAMGEAADAEKSAWDQAAADRLEGRPLDPNALKARDIVVIGSTVGRHISPFSSLYGSTKFAVNALAEAARRELGPRGVRVTLIEPAIVVSEFQGIAGYDPAGFGELMRRVGPVLLPEDIAAAITHAVSLPAWIHLNDLVVRGTRQDYP